MTVPRPENTRMNTPRPPKTVSQGNSAARTQ